MKSEKTTAAQQATTDDAGVRRGRPGRRSAAERREAVLKLLAGRASVDQLALEYGVLAQTIEGWREEALKGIEQAFTTGADPRSGRERELEQKVEQLNKAVGELTVEKQLLLKAVEEWKRESGHPSRPTRSRR